jgi:hypothetical protein
MKNILPYIAGYIDGDGCFYLGNFYQGKILVYEQSIQIVSVKKPVLIEFKEAFGGSIRQKPYKTNHKDAFCWTIKGQKAIDLSNLILNYLVDRKNQCEIFIQFGQTIKHNKFRTISVDVIEIRNNLIEQIRKDKHMENLITKESIEALENMKNTITPIEDDYPYLAGLIDSEGCFRIKKWKPKNKPNHAYNITVEIGNTKLPVMPWLVKRFGGSVVFIPAKGVKKSSATWTLSAAALYQILPKIRSYLISKKDVCDKLIEFQQTILPNGGDRHSELFRALFEKRREIREKIIEEVHNLNRKGSN